MADSVEFRPAPSIDVVPVEFRGGVTAPAWSESTVRVREREREREGESELSAVVRTGKKKE